jgi:predicted secreted hydrolase
MDRRDFVLALAGLTTVQLQAGQAPGDGADAASSAAPVFPPVLPGRTFVFPADHGAHPDFRTEWWYATGWLRLPDGRALGFQTTFFRVRTGLGDTSASAFAPRQLVLAHAAVADPALGHLRHDQRSARVGLGRAGFEAAHVASHGNDNGTEVWVGDWRLELRAGVYHAQVRSSTFAYALRLMPTGAPVLHGRAGFSTKAPDPVHASYYYSRPQLQVQGSVTLAGQTHAVTGQAWLDHEWSSELLPTGAQGWDWIGINLADGSALMAFRLRGQSGAPSAALWSAATLAQPGGATQTFEPQAVAFEPLAHWQSPRTGISYPVQWRLRVGPRQFTLQALMPDQELDSRLSTGAIYWEGAVRLLEAGQEVGRGYLEMTGYGEKIRMD